jgi:hypothetical protein
MAARAALNKALRTSGLPWLVLASVQAAELRQVGDERCGHDWTDAAHRAQSFGEAIKLPIARDVALDRLRSVLARRPRALRKARIVLGWSFT